MEERKLRSRLIWIYFVTIAAVLAALLVALLLFSAQKIDQSNRENFSTLMTAIGDELQSGDIIVLNAPTGLLQAELTDAEWEARPLAIMPTALQQANHRGLGRELFAGFRRNALSAEEGACTWLLK